MRQVFKFLAKEFLLAGHLMSLGASIVGSFVFLILDQPINFWVVISIYLFVQPIYWFDRWYDLEVDGVENQTRSSHIKKYKSLIPVLIFLFLVSFSVITLSLSQVILAIAGWILFIGGVFYAVLFKHLTKIIPLFKNYFVAAFNVLFVIYSALFVGLPTSWPLAIYGVFIFFRALMIQILFDTKDVEEDEEFGLKTLPVVTSKDFSFMFLQLINLATGLLLVYSVWQGLFSVGFLLLLIPVFNLGYVIFKIKRNPTVNLYIQAGFDYILQGIALLFIIIS